jgi:hypothetical protein
VPKVQSVRFPRHDQKGTRLLSLRAMLGMIFAALRREKFGRRAANLSSRSRLQQSTVNRDPVAD